MNASRQIVIVELIGGLGNQMFQYAAGHALAKHHQATLGLDMRAMENYTHWDYGLDRLNIDAAPVDVSVLADLGLRSSAPSLVQRAQNKWLNKTPQSRGPVYQEQGFHFDANLFETLLPVLLKGYFQSEKYFQKHADEIRRLFSLAGPLSDHSQGFEKKIEQAECPVSVHIRRGDYVSNPQTAKVHGQPGLAYYQKALAVLGGLCTGPMQLFFFSDDMDYAQNHFGDLPDVHFVRDNGSRPWEDMHLMSRCRHHIIANSSFSWWGAWLNPSATKQVVAPRAWFQRDTMLTNNTLDLCPPSWILV